MSGELEDVPVQKAWCTRPSRPSELSQLAAPKSDVASRGGPMHYPCYSSAH